MSTSFGGVRDTLPQRPPWCLFNLSSNSGDFQALGGTEIRRTDSASYLVCSTYFCRPESSGVAKLRAYSGSGRVRGLLSKPKCCTNCGWFPLKPQKGTLKKDTLTCANVCMFGEDQRLRARTVLMLRHLPNLQIGCLGVPRFCTPFSNKKYIQLKVRFLDGFGFVGHGTLLWVWQLFSPTAVRSKLILVHSTSTILGILILRQTHFLGNETTTEGCVLGRLLEQAESYSHQTNGLPEKPLHHQVELPDPELRSRAILLVPPQTLANTLRHDAIEDTTVDGRNPAPPKKPCNVDSPVNTNHGFPMVSRWSKWISQPSTLSKANLPHCR